MNYFIFSIYLIFRYLKKIIGGVLTNKSDIDMFTIVDGVIVSQSP